MNLSDGPLVGFFHGTYYPLNRYGGSSSLPDGPLVPSDIDPGMFRADYLRLHELYGRIAGDTIWAGSVFWGIPWMEALSGCGVIADHATGSCRSVRPEADPEPADIPAFDPESPWARKADEFLDLLTAPEIPFPLGTTLMRGFSDILSALYGTPGFVYRLHDGDRAIGAVVERIVELWTGFADFQIDRFPDFHGGTGSYFYNLWMPGRGTWIQEDAAALLSPGLFEGTILPALERVIAHFDSVIIHLHPAGYIPVDPLVETGLAAVELHIDKGGPSAEELLPVYRKIQSRKPLIIWGDLNEADLGFIKGNLDLAALTILPVVESPEAAERIWDMMKG